MSKVGSPSLDSKLETYWLDYLLVHMPRDEQVVGLAYERSSRIAPRGVVITTTRMLIYKTYVNPKYGLLSLHTSAPTDDISIGTITRVETAGSERLTVATNHGREYKLRLTKTTDADFVAAKLAGAAGIAVTRAAGPADAAADIAPRQPFVAPGDTWLNRRSPVFRKRFAWFFAPLYSVLFLLIAGYVLYSVGSWMFSSPDAAPSSRCDDLRDWYADQPYDSNPDIARDYYNSCDALPPPVLNGELIMEGGDFVYR